MYPLLLLYRSVMKTSGNFFSPNARIDHRPIQTRPASMITSVSFTTANLKLLQGRCIMFNLGLAWLGRVLWHNGGASQVFTLLEQGLRQVQPAVTACRGDMLALPCTIPYHPFSASQSCTP